MRLPEDKIDLRLRTEVALALYAQGLLSLGKGSELAGVTRYQFGELLEQRGTARHCGPDELAADVGYARRQHITPN